MIIDADGLNIIASDPDLTGFLYRKSDLTPHLGEMARLTGKIGTGDPGRSAILWCAVQQRQRRDLCVKGCGNCSDGAGWTVLCKLQR